MLQERFDPVAVSAFENATWSRCADTYAEGFGALVREAIVPLLDALRVGRGDRVLDVGTGPGLVAAASRERGADVVGVDFSEAMLAAARHAHPDIPFELAPAESLPFEDASFDVVLGNFVLHHSGRPERVLAEASRVARPGGRIGFTVWGDMSKLEAFGLFFAAVEAHAGAAELPHGPLFGVSDSDVFHELLGAAGLRDISITELPIAWRTLSIDAYLMAFHHWANLGTFPEDVRQRIEATVRANADRYRSDGSLVIPNPAILVQGVA